MMAPKKVAKSTFANLEGNILIPKKNSPHPSVQLDLYTQPIRNQDSMILGTTYHEFIQDLP